MKNEKINEIKEFWNYEACGTHFVQNANDKKDFFEKYREFRYKTEWHILDNIDFSKFGGKRVLEIGCGNGADAYMMAKNGAKYVGVDITETAIEQTKLHLALNKLDGEFRVENAEALSFAEFSFDIVYSYGVLHHTARPDRAIKEVYRVLKMNGEAMIMLYHKNSFNYYIRILLFFRLRIILHILFNIFNWKKDRLKYYERFNIRDWRDKNFYKVHYINFLKYGFSYLKADNIIHHCTDGPECPYAYCYSKKDIKILFKDFKKVETQIAHFPISKYKFLKFTPFYIEKFLAKHLGWYVYVFAKK